MFTDQHPNMELLTTVLLTSLLVVAVSKIWRACLILLWRPYALSRSFRKQGISGPPHKLLSGSLDEIKRLKKEAEQNVLEWNSHDISTRVVPQYNKWFSEYGETFLYWYGTEPRICISDPELAKQILSNKFGFYVKPNSRPELLKLSGKGLAFVDGLDWVRHKRILNPAFSMDKLKGMTKRMADCTISMLEEWKQHGAQVQIDIHKESIKLTADIIASTAFGSSYAQGIEAFKAQRELLKCCAASITKVYIPGSQYLPTPTNLAIWRLDRKAKESLRKIIVTRLNSKPAEISDSGYGDDLLGLMITAAEADESKENGMLKMSMEEIIEECKTFFFAGHETTSNLLTWTMMLLGSNQDWQEKLRQEVFDQCGRANVPDANSLAKLKLMNMVVMEVLRLYCPAMLLVREASQDMKLGHVSIPKGTCVSIPIVMIHRKKELWGEDANEFNPLRFVNGVSKAAAHPNALIPFSVGPRACIGQNFALLEAKTVLAMILQRFRFCLAAEYKHAPADRLTLQPQYGLPIIIKPLDF